MNFIDITLVIIIGIFCAKGLFRGLIIEVFTLVGLILGYVIALRFKGNIAVFIESNLRIPEIPANIIGFLLLFILILLLFRWLAGLLRRFVKWTFMGWLDRGGGFLFGFLKGALIASVLLMLLSFIPFRGEIQREQEESVLYEPVLSVAPGVFNFIKHAFPKTKDFYEEVKEGFSNQSRNILDRMKSKQMEALQDELEKHVKQE